MEYNMFYNVKEAGMSLRAGDRGFLPATMNVVAQQLSLENTM